eukprot:g1167.t1
MEPKEAKRWEYRLLHLRRPEGRRISFDHHRHHLHRFLSGPHRVAWTAENESGSLAVAQHALGAPRRRGEDTRPVGAWYSSFVVEGEVARCFMEGIQSEGGEEMQIPLQGWHPTGTVWCFVGSNPGTDGRMVGKPEHVDQLKAGVVTMHSQLAGNKVWLLRPHPLANAWASRTAPALAAERLEIVCHEGDRLIIDTTAWYHSTSILPDTDFTCSIAQDLAKGPQSADQTTESIQLRVSHQLCQPSGPSIPKGPGDRWKIPPNYEVKQLIGTGSYGSVCEAFDNDKKRLVAIKRIAHMFEDLIDCKRILREIAILSKLEHENIVQVYDIVAPSNIHKLCWHDVTLTPLHINTLLYNLLVGLKYLHSAGIYHRDLKPANCLVNQDCSVKICDFGLSRAIEAAEQPHLHALPNTPRGDGEPEAGGKWDS